MGLRKGCDYRAATDAVKFATNEASSIQQGALVNKLIKSRVITKNTPPMNTAMINYLGCTGNSWKGRK